MSATDFELEQLRSQVATLEQLLEVHEQTSHKQTLRLENIVNSISDGFLVLDRGWRITYFNNVAAETFLRLARNTADLIGRQIWSEFPELTGTEIHRRYRHAMEANEAQTFETYYSSIDSWFEIHAYPSPEGLSVYFQDITQRKRAQQERDRLLEAERSARQELEIRSQEVQELNAHLERRVQQRTAELETAIKELEAFSYSVSHDLRAPLRTIEGFSQALLEFYLPSLDAAAQGYLKRIAAASEKMAQLIDSLLQLSRVTRADLSMESIDLTRLAGEIITELREASPGRKVDVSIEPGLKTMGDKKLLHILLVNLFSNAWKFTSKKDDAKIEFGSQREGDKLIYFLRDNGAGFDMAFASKLFRAFQRLHQAKEFDGTGIGLATAHRVVRRHNGSIWAAAEEKQGATFYFTLQWQKVKNEPVYDLAS
jgi:signal transduction histidine kinase